MKIQSSPGPGKSRALPNLQEPRPGLMAIIARRVSCRS